MNDFLTALQIILGVIAMVCFGVYLVMMNRIMRKWKRGGYE